MTDFILHPVDRDSTVIVLDTKVVLSREIQLLLVPNNFGGDKSQSQECFSHIYSTFVNMLVFGGKSLICRI